MATQETPILHAEYVLLDKLGQGAFGEVYRAHDVALGVDRAIKILRRAAPGTGSTQFDLARQRFELEAQLGAQLEQRRAARCVRVYGFRKEADSLYLIMEYMPGGSLADRLKRGALSVEETIRLAHDAALGLSELHALKAVHRDIKPGNILFDAEGRACIADFGLAQLPRGMSLGSLGSAGELRLQPGTPEYMSPEQSRHEQFLTSASDVFSLGAVLFEALTGEQYRTLRPGTRVIELRGEVPAWLDKLIARMLASAPEARPFGGQELVQILEAKIHEAEALQSENAHRQRVAELSNEAKRHMAERNWVAAITSLRAWLVLEPNLDAQNMLKQAEQALACEKRIVELLTNATLASGERRWVDAQSALRDVLALDPGNRDAGGLMTTVNAQLGELQRVRALADRARNAAGKRRWRDAQQAARAWLAVEPGNGEAIKIEREATEALAGPSQRLPAKLAGFAIVGLVFLGIAVVAAIANGSPTPGYAPTREFIAQTSTPTQPTQIPAVTASATASPPTSTIAADPASTPIAPTPTKTVEPNATHTAFSTATRTPTQAPTAISLATPVPTTAPTALPAATPLAKANTATTTPILIAAKLVGSAGPRTPGSSVDPELVKTGVSLTNPRVVPSSPEFADEETLEVDWWISPAIAEQINQIYWTEDRRGYWYGDSKIRPGVYPLPCCPVFNNGNPPINGVLRIVVSNPLDGIGGELLQSPLTTTELLIVVLYKHRNDSENIQFMTGIVFPYQRTWTR